MASDKIIGDVRHSGEGKGVGKCDDEGNEGGISNDISLDGIVNISRNSGEAEAEGEGENKCMIKVRDTNTVINNKTECSKSGQGHGE